MSIALITALLAAPATLPACSWDRPGLNPFMGDVVAAVDHYPDIPLEVRKKLKERMAKRAYDEIATIQRDAIVGKASYEPTIRDMHFGAGQVCNTVTRTRWTDKMQERGLVYCESGHCLIVPTVCRNVSRITRKSAAVASNELQPTEAATKLAEAPTENADAGDAEVSDLPRLRSAVAGVFGGVVAGVVTNGVVAAVIDSVRSFSAVVAAWPSALISVSSIPSNVATALPNFPAASGNLPHALARVGVAGGLPAPVASTSTSLTEPGTFVAALVPGAGAVDTNPMSELTPLVVRDIAPSGNGSGPTVVVVTAPGGAAGTPLSPTTTTLSDPTIDPVVLAGPGPGNGGSPYVGNGVGPGAVELPNGLPNGAPTGAPGSTPGGSPTGTPGSLTVPEPPTWALLLLCVLLGGFHTTGWARSRK